MAHERAHCSSAADSSAKQEGLHPATWLRGENNHHVANCRGLPDPGIAQSDREHPLANTMAPAIMTPRHYHMDRTACSNGWSTPAPQEEHPSAVPRVPDGSERPTAARSVPATPAGYPAKLCGFEQGRGARAVVGGTTGTSDLVALWPRTARHQSCAAAAACAPRYNPGRPLTDISIVKRLTVN